MRTSKARCGGYGQLDERPKEHAAFHRPLGGHSDWVAVTLRRSADAKTAGANADFCATDHDPRIGADPASAKPPERANCNRPERPHADARPGIGAVTADP